jgi:hypothetical protein
MDAIAYAATHGRIRTVDKIRKPAAQRRGWFLRFMVALSETRGQQAEREIRKHAHLVSRTLDE